MALKIPETLFQEYMSTKMKVDKEQLRLEFLAAKIRDLERKGYEHPQLRFDANITWRPDWKKLVMELVKKYMKPGPRAMFMKSLHSRFKKTQGKKKICILAPRYEKHQETILELKAKYGLNKKGKEKETVEE